jgi:hypothetical protein
LKISNASGSFPTINPNLQVSFYYRLQALRDLYLREALKETVKKLDLREVDVQLNSAVAPAALNRVASYGVRGEVFFPVPCVIEANPFLLGYYRLLFGLSQKEFYSKGPFGKFKKLEDLGEIPENLKSEVEKLCQSLIRTAEILVDRLDELSVDVVHDLQVLTLGPQLRGSENTRIGQEATQEVFELIRQLVHDYLKEATKRTLILENDSKRTVLVEFLSDPDIRITQKLESRVRPLVSIEIKGGTDASNIHNRLGEAEKSHQKARNQGFLEFWTIIRVDVNLSEARRESPTTSHFFHLDDIKDKASEEHKRFREMLGSLLGIRI